MSGASSGSPTPAEPERRCAFCGAGPGKSFRLLGTGAASICDGCVQSFQDQLDVEGERCPVCRLPLPRSGRVQLAHLRAVCYACVLALAQQVVLPAEPVGDGDDLVCSFCSRRQREAGRFFAGRSAFICERCVARCNAHVSEDAAASGQVRCPVCRRAVRAEEMVQLPERKSLCLDCVSVVRSGAGRGGGGRGR